MSRNERHVVYRNGGWFVVNPKSDRGPFDTQKKASRRGRKILRKNGGGELVIHRKDGTIRDSDTVPPGNDPFPPRG